MGKAREYLVPKKAERTHSFPAASLKAVSDGTSAFGNLTVDCVNRTVYTDGGRSKEGKANPKVKNESVAFEAVLPRATKKGMSDYIAFLTSHVDKDGEPTVDATAFVAEAVRSAVVQSMVSQCASRISTDGIERIIPRVSPLRTVDREELQGQAVTALLKDQEAGKPITLEQLKAILGEIEG